ncbi:hypothetical protein ATCCBAA256_11290 [Mycobacterium montefiorense]|nr:hypothetical protein ATCCBAA256_11290 [Mycobacterium montefiorense]
MQCHGNRTNGFAGGHLERLHRIRADAQLSDQHIERGFQRPALLRRAPDLASATVAHASRAGHHRGGQDRRQRQQRRGHDSGADGDAAGPARPDHDPSVRWGRHGDSWPR